MVAATSTTGVDEWSAPDPDGISVMGPGVDTQLVVRLSAGNQWVGDIRGLAALFAEAARGGTQPILDEVLIDTLSGLVPARFSVRGEYDTMVAWAQHGIVPETVVMYMWLHPDPGLLNPDGYRPASPAPMPGARYVVPPWPGAVRSTHVGWGDGLFAAYQYGLPHHMAGSRR